MIGLKTVSTGVLRKEPVTISTVVNLVNTGLSCEQVVIEVWNWSSYSNPVQLPVLIGNNQPVDFPYSLPAGNLAVMYTNLSGVLFYEVRVTYAEDTNIVVNSFGRSNALAAQEGNTVLNNQFVQIESDCS